MDPKNLNTNPLDATLGSTAAVSDDSMSAPTGADSPLGQSPVDPVAAPVDPVAPAMGSSVVEPVSPVATGTVTQSPFAASEEPTASDPVADPGSLGTPVPEDTVPTTAPVGTVNTPLTEEPEAVETAPAGLGGDTKLSS